MIKNLFAAGLALLTLTLVSCQPDETTNPTPSASYEAGIYVTSEGAFPAGSGSLSHLNRQNGTFVQQLFEQANGRPLGNTTQAMAHWNNTGIIVVNNGNKLELVNLTDFKATGEIVGFELPSRIAVVGDKAYVTEWVSFGGNGRLKVVDMTTKTVVKTLATGPFPDALQAHNGLLYVANSNSNDIYVLNTTTDTYVDTLTVGDWPNSFAVDAGGFVWVLCGGLPAFMGTPTEASLWKLDGSITPMHIDLGLETSPSDLCANADKNKLYYSMQNKVYEHDRNALMASTTVVLNRNFYAIGFDPITGYFYCTDAGDFNSAGKLIRYNLSFAAVDSFATGVAPGSIYFK
jgi:YVTN family beta-propeller protein